MIALVRHREIFRLKPGLPLAPQELPRLELLERVLDEFDDYRPTRII